MSKRTSSRAIVWPAGMSLSMQPNAPLSATMSQQSGLSLHIPRLAPSYTVSRKASKAAPSKSATTAVTVPSELEEEFALMLRAFKLPKPDRQHKFDASRGWRFDFAWPDQLVAVEIEGGIWTRGKSGHTSGAGITRDAEKSNAAQLQGWLVLRFVESHLRDGRAIEWTRQALGNSK